MKLKFGQLGDGGTDTDKTMPTAVNQANLSSGEGFVALNLGYYHSCGLTNSGKAYCWGRDIYGQLGDGGTDTDKLLPTAVNQANLSSGEGFVALGVGGYHSCGLTNSGKAYCWGYNGDGELGDGTFASKTMPTTAVNQANLTSGESFVALSLGYYHSCALTNSGEAYCWGYDSYGQLGDAGADTDMEFPVAVNQTGL